MPKNKRRRLPSSGLYTSAADLFLLAGLPHPLHTPVGQFLQRLAGSSVKVIASPSPSFDGRLYRKQAIQTLLRASAQFVVRQLENRTDDQAARPRRIVLLYVPAEDAEALVDAFDFFVFPIPLRDLERFDELGHQRRHQREACEQAIHDAIEFYKANLIGVLQRKIESRKSNEPLLLPPGNFRLPDERLRQVFRELTRETRAWASAMPDAVAAETFDHEKLPKFLRPQEHQVMFKDARGVVFPCARPTEMHGTRGGYEPSADVKELCEVLKSTYRFGISLPQGFHHDAQFDSGKRFHLTPFDCCQKGELLVSGSHANIYPNDFVNPAR